MTDPARPRRLHIGGKASHPDWEIFNILAAENVDHTGDAADLSRFPNNTFDALYASHVLEHFSIGAVQQVLEEWHRVLRPGGTLYLSVPNLETLAKMFLAKDKVSFQGRFFVVRMMFGGQMDEYDFHKAGFDAEIATNLLWLAGYSDLKQVADFGIFDDTSKMLFNGTPISLNLTARKPALRDESADYVRIAGKNFAVFDNDVFAVSFPCSGNTWLRFMLAEIVHRPPALNFTTLSRYAPDVYVSVNETMLAAQRPRFVKSHERYNPRYRNPICIVRDPRDVAVSFFHQLKKIDGAAEFGTYFDAFMRGKIWEHHGIGTWRENVESWLEHPDEVVIVRYEDLLENTGAALRTIVARLAPGTDDKLIEKAVAKFRFENMRRMENDARGVPYLDKSREIPFVRKGRAGQWRDELEPRQIARINAEFGPTMEKLGYRTTAP